MMPASAPYLATQERLQRTPVYKVKFDSWDVPYSTHPIRIFTDEILDTATVADTFTIDEAKEYELADDFPHIDQSVVGDLFAFSASSGVATSKAYASLFEGQQSQVFPEQGHSSIGSVTFVLTDLDEDVTNLVMSGILGERVQLFAGFDDIDEEDYLLFFTGVVASIRSENLAGYEITVYSSQSLINRQVFNVGVSVLSVALTESTNTAFSYDVNAGELSGFGVYFRIDDEIIWAGQVGNGTAPIISRGSLGTIAAAHEVGAEIREVIRLGPAHPMEILLGLYQNTDNTGVGLDPSYIDMAGISAAIPLIGAAYQMEFRITEPANAMQWAEREIFQPLGAYPVTKSDGRNSIVVFRAPSSEDSVATIDHDSIVHDGQRPMMTWELGRDGSLGQIINDVTWLFDYNVLTGNFASSFQIVRQASIDRFGRYPMIIEASGFRSELPNTLTLMAARGLQLLNRYESGSPVVRLTTFLQKELIEPGEIISLTSALLPNRATKTRGVTEALMEVVNRNVRFASGQVDFDLLWTSFGELSRDDFNREDVDWSDDATLGTGIPGAWSAMAQDTRGIHIEDGELYLGRLGTKLAGAGALASGHGAMVRTQVVGANQSSQLTFRGVLDSGGFAGPAVRANFVFGSGGGFEWLVTMSGYAAMYDSINDEITLRLYNGTDPQVSTGLQLADAYPVTLVDGDKLRIDARGSNIRVYLNDVVIIGPIHNTVQTTNYPGALSNYTGTAGGILYDDWSGGDSGFA